MRSIVRRSPNAASRLLSVGLPLLLAACPEKPAPAPSAADAARTSAPATSTPDAAVAPAPAPADAALAAPAQAPDGALDPSASLDFALKVAPDGQNLLVEYVITSRAASTLQVCNGLLESRGGGLVPQPDALVVLNGDAPGAVRLVCGALYPETTSAAYVYPPVYAALPPGGKLTRTVELPLPLRAWHNVVLAAPLKGTPTSVTLEVHYLAGQVTWGPLGDAGLQQPLGAERRGVLVAGPKAIPAAPAR